MKLQSPHSMFPSGGILIVVMIIRIKTKGSVALSNLGKVFLLRTQWEEEEGGRVSAK